MSKSLPLLGTHIINLNIFSYTIMKIYFNRKSTHLSLHSYVLSRLVTQGATVYLPRFWPVPFLFLVVYVIPFSPIPSTPRPGGWLSYAPGLSREIQGTQHSVLLSLGFCVPGDHPLGENPTNVGSLCGGSILGQNCASSSSSARKDFLKLREQDKWKLQGYWGVLEKGPEKFEEQRAPEPTSTPTLDLHSNSRTPERRWRHGRSGRTGAVVSTALQGFLFVAPHGNYAQVSSAWGVKKGAEGASGLRGRKMEMRPAQWGFSESMTDVYTGYWIIQKMATWIEDRKNHILAPDPTQN